MSHDPVNHPKHYTSHPSGVECIQIVEHLSFCLGNAMKYIWRAGEKGSKIGDLKKARWYLDREIARLEVGIPKPHNYANGEGRKVPLFDSAEIGGHQ